MPFVQSLIPVRAYHILRPGEKYVKMILSCLGKWGKLLDLTQLHQFITVAECQNVSQAAHKLYITQPALSRSISRLESELEVRLFDRKSNSLILNESGKIFLQHVSAGLDAINAGVHAVRQKNNNRRVLVSNYIFLDDFASFCDRCLTAFPDVDLACFDGTRTVSDYPTDTAPDLVIIPQQNFRGYTVTKAYTEPWCVMFHESYQFHSDCDRSVITREQLNQESIIFDNSPYDRQMLSQIFRQLPAGLHFASQPDESRISINRCRSLGIVPVAAYRSLKLRVPDTPIRAMSIRDIKLERTVYLSHRAGFLSSAEDYAILELLDQHIDRELRAVAAMKEKGFVCP